MMRREVLMGEARGGRDAPPRVKDEHLFEQIQRCKA
jgi:hypothetical protein